jgi:hypothetical protein
MGHILYTLIKQDFFHTVDFLTALFSHTYVGALLSNNSTIQRRVPAFLFCSSSSEIAVDRHQDTFWRLEQM